MNGRVERSVQNVSINYHCSIDKPSLQVCRLVLLLRLQPAESKRSRQYTISLSSRAALLPFRQGFPHLAERGFGIDRIDTNNRTNACLLVTTHWLDETCVVLGDTVLRLDALLDTCRNIYYCEWLRCPGCSATPLREDESLFLFACAARRYARAARRFSPRDGRAVGGYSLRLAPTDHGTEGPPSLGGFGPLGLRAEPRSLGTSLNRPRTPVACGILLPPRDCAALAAIAERPVRAAGASGRRGSPGGELGRGSRRGCGGGRRRERSAFLARCRAQC